MKKEWKVLLTMVAGFLLCFYLPVERLQGWTRFTGAVWESLYLVRWYAQEHVLLCLIPAFMIAGAIGIFISQESVMRYLGPGAHKPTAYAVASVSGTILAVCSCTVLPLFAGIYRMGAGLGPAVAFLYSGPAINVLAIILTARILGMSIGIARAAGAVGFSVVIGLLMHVLFLKEERARETAGANDAKGVAAEGGRSLLQNGVYFASMVGILVFANFGKPMETTGLWYAIYSIKWWLTAVCALVLAFALVRWFGASLWKMGAAVGATSVASILVPHEPLAGFGVGIVSLSLVLGTSEGELQEWLSSSWSFAKQIMPLLLGGVLAAGFLLGRPGHEGMIPSSWIAALVGSNSVFANLFSAVVGAFMYFATLTEVPILQGLMGSGMSKGPALALLLAGPALSLPNMLVIRSIMGTWKTVWFVVLVVAMASLSGILFGSVAR